MATVEIKVLKYETRAGQKVRFGEIVELPEDEADRAVVCNVAKYVTKPPANRAEEETTRQEPDKQSSRRK